MQTRGPVDVLHQFFSEKFAHGAAAFDAVAVAVLSVPAPFQKHLAELFCRSLSGELEYESRRPFTPQVMATLLRLMQKYPKCVRIQIPACIRPSAHFCQK